MITDANITVEDLGTIKIVHITGQLDESNIDEKIQAIYKLVEANPKNLNLIYDLESLEYMNSKSIGYLTDLYGKITESGGKVAIAKAKPNIFDILQVVGLTQLIPCFDSTELAKNSFGPATPAAPVAAATTPATPAPAPAVPPTPATPAPSPEVPAPAPVAPSTPIPAPVAPVVPQPPAQQ
ncbi:MAG: STAS domain-containing protein [Patescibacteria group bacterium]